MSQPFPICSATPAPQSFASFAEANQSVRLPFSIADLIFNKACE
jgi:hypothetical protein